MMQAIRQACSRTSLAGRPRHHPPTARRGMLLLVVLIILSVLALIAVSFSYRMDAERMGIEALGDLQQARLAAESGLERIKLILRDSRTNMDLWYSNPDAFRRMPVWMPGDVQEEGIGGTESPISKEAVPNQPAWRFSVVSYEQLDEDRVVIRYGLTDEAGKLNINFASRGELLRLVSHLDLGDTPPEALVDALIDWRDPDNDVNSPAGAETAWYMTLPTSYRAKNRPFETVDELLMVKEWNGRFLYGEDYNRNGYMDENEDDGEEGAFPPDDGDGQLERGMARLMTTYSWDWNFANDNKPRENINSVNWEKLASGEYPKRLEYLLEEISSDTINFLAEAKKRGFKFRSIGELWGLEVYEDGSSNYDEFWEQYRQQVKDENAVPKEEEDQQQEGEEESPSDQEGSTDENPEDNPDNDGRQDSGGSPEDVNQDEQGSDADNNPADEQDEGDQRTSAGAKDNRRRQQAIRDDRADNQDSSAGGLGRARGSDRGRGRDRSAGREETRDDRPDSDDNTGRSGRGGRPGDGRQPDQPVDGRQPGAGLPGQGSAVDDRERKGTPIVSPITPDQMNVVMDRLTTTPSAVLAGQYVQVNVNTAPAEVLGSIIGMTEEEAKAIVERRRSMAGADKLTPAWLVTTGTMTPERFAVLANKFTARSIQFTADVIGFADHVGTFRRLQVVLEMRGHIAQVRYYRDISSLGLGFPVKDDERSEGFAFSPE